MSSEAQQPGTHANAPIVRRLAPWAVVLLVGALMSGMLPVAQAATGASASDAIPVGTDGKFSGVDQPSRSTWFIFQYVPGQAATVSVTYEPADANRMDIFIYTPTADPNNPRKEGVSSTRNNNTLTITFTDPSTRPVLISVENDHPDRTVSFVGSVSPTTAVATPVPTSSSATATPVTTPTPGPVATSSANALTIDQTGLFVGTLTSNQAVWYRFYYNNPGANATVNVGMAPTADGTDLNLYTGTDVNSLTQQTGSATRNGNTLTRTVNLPNAQFVYLAVVNNNSTQVVAYSGTVSPAFAPPLTPTAVTTAVATAAATAATTPTAAPTSVPAPAPQVPHDARYFAETGYRIDDDAIYAYFQGRGQIEAFGFPVSRTFRFLGCQVQIFQRQVAQNCGNGSVQLMNVLDPEIFPYTRVNGSIFPGPDDSLKNQTPQVGSPNYATAILDFVRANAPDTFQNQPTNFMTTFFNSVSPQQAGTSDPNLIGLFDLEIWGAPISRPQPDPSNASFIYQRFQRGIMHYTAGQGTRGILLADYLKQIILGPTLPGGAPNQTLPPDLAQQAQSSKYYAQYCPGGVRWECRPNDLTDTDLTFAFERG